MIVGITRKDGTIMLKQRVIKRVLIILLVCCSVMIMGILFLRPIYLREKSDTERKIKTALEDQVKYPRISIRGKTVVVDWISFDNRSCGTQDFNSMLLINEIVKENHFISKAQIYVYNSDGDKMYDYWSGEVEVPTKYMIPNGPKVTEPVESEG